MYLPELTSRCTVESAFVIVFLQVRISTHCSSVKLPEASGKMSYTAPTVVQDESVLAILLCKCLKVMFII